MKKLNLRKNKIDKIAEELPPLPALEYLNVRSNSVQKMEDLLRLMNADTFPALQDLNVINCGIELNYSSMNIFLAEILEKKPNIKRFCKVTVTDAHRLEAVYLAKYKFEVAEAERKRIEAEEKAKAEAEAAAAEEN